MAKGDYTGQGIDKTSTAKDDMTPDFLKHSEDNPDKPNHNLNAPLGQENKATRNGETNVSSDKPNRKDSDTEQTEKTEGNKNPADFRNNVQGRDVMKAMTGGAGAKAALVKKAFDKAGPGVFTGAIIASSFILLSLGSTSFMLANFAELFNIFDPTRVANYVQSRVLMKGILGGKYNKDGLWGKLSKKMKNSFEGAGYRVESDGSDGNAVSIKDTETGKPLTAASFENMDNSTLVKTTNAMAEQNNSVHTYRGEQGEILRQQMRIDYDSLDNASKASTPDEAKAAVDETIKEGLDNSPRMNGEFDSESKTTTKDQTTGETSIDTHTDTETLEIKSEADIKGEMETKIKTELTGEAKAGINMDKIGLGGKVANGVCQVYNILTQIGRMVKAYELAQVIVVAFTFLQAIDRMRAGEGGADLLVDTIGNYLITEKSFTTRSGDTIKGSILSSSPITSLFGGPKLLQSDPIVESFLVTDNDIGNVIRNMPGTNGAIGYRHCIGIQLSAAVIDFVTDIVSFFTSGGLISIIEDAAMAAVLSASIALVVSAVVPLITHSLTRNFTALTTGPEASGGIFWGVSHVTQRMGQMLGFRPATKKTWNSYVAQRSNYLSEMARYERATHSPFDTSSQYTFMGSIMSKLSTISFSKNTIIGKIGSVMSATNKSLLALTPASHAADFEDTMVSEGACALNEINGTSPDDKMYCNAFEVSWNVPDFDYMNTDPEEVMKFWQTHENHLIKNMGTGSFVTNYDPVTNPNPAIKEDTDLALHLEEYNNRESELNVPDAKIENKYANVGTTGITILDAIIGVIPVGGSVIDIINNEQKREHIEQILGSQYTKSDIYEILYENAMAEHYAHLQDMGVAFGVFDTNQASNYMIKYYDKNPLDQSFEGVIARYSGLSKETVIANLQIMETYNFIAHYEPAGLGPLVIEPELKSQIRFENDNLFMGYVATIINNSHNYYRKDQYITA